MFGIVRLNANGTVDGNFGSGGKVRTDIARRSDIARGVALQADGKIVVAGGIHNERKFGLARYAGS